MRPGRRSRRCESYKFFAPSESATTSVAALRSSRIWNRLPNSLWWNFDRSMNPDCKLTLDRFHRPFWTANRYQNSTTFASGWATSLSPAARCEKFLVRVGGKTAERKAKLFFQRKRTGNFSGDARFCLEARSVGWGQCRYPSCHSRYCKPYASAERQPRGGTQKIDLKSI